MLNLQVEIFIPALCFSRMTHRSVIEDQSDGIDVI